MWIIPLGIVTLQHGWTKQIIYSPLYHPRQEQKCQTPIKGGKKEAFTSVLGSLCWSATFTRRETSRSRPRFADRTWLVTEITESLTELKMKTNSISVLIKSKTYDAFVLRVTVDDQIDYFSVKLDPGHSWHKAWPWQAILQQPSKARVGQKWHVHFNYQKINK